MSFQRRQAKFSTTQFFHESSQKVNYSAIILQFLPIMVPLHSEMIKFKTSSVQRWLFSRFKNKQYYWNEKVFCNGLEFESQAFTYILTVHSLVKCCSTIKVHWFMCSINFCMYIRILYFSISWFMKIYRP